MWAFICVLTLRLENIQGEPGCKSPTPYTTAVSLIDLTCLVVIGVCGPCSEQFLGGKVEDF